MTLWKLEKIGELRFGLPELCNASSATRADESCAKKKWRALQREPTKVVRRRRKNFLETVWRARLRLASSTQGRALLRLENKKDGELCCAFLFYMRKENRASIAAPEALTNYKKNSITRYGYRTRLGTMANPKPPTRSPGVMSLNFYCLRFSESTASPGRVVCCTRERNATCMHRVELHRQNPRGQLCCAMRLRTFEKKWRALLLLASPASPTQKGPWKGKMASSATPAEDTFANNAKTICRNIVASLAAPWG